MGDIESLLLVLALLYLSECLVWVRRGGVAFVGSWLRSCQVRTPPRFAANQRGGLLMTSLLPGWDSAFLAAPVAVSFSPEGFYAYAAVSLDPLGRGRDDGPCFAWDAIRQVEADGPRVVLNGENGFDCVSSEGARQVVEWVRQVRRRPAGERAEAIEELLRGCLDPDQVRARLEAGSAGSRVLRWGALGLFCYLFGLVPWVLLRHGFGTPAVVLAAGALFQTAAMSWWFRRAHRELYPGAGEERFKHFLIMVLAPPAAIRAPDVLQRHLLATFHPLAIAQAVGDARCFREFARRVLVDLRWPLLPVCRSEDAVRRRIECWFRELQMRVVERYLRERGIEPADLLCPPEPAEAANQAYCPRCRAQYLRLDARCADCGGRGLEPLMTPSASTDGSGGTGGREPECEGERRGD